VVVDTAQLAPHRPLPADAGFLAWSGHKVYAPFGAGVLVGPRSQFVSAGWIESAKPEAGWTDR
jgi:selenocysteine lyase/cysteine desulfurase